MNQIFLFVIQPALAIAKHFTFDSRKILFVPAAVMIEFLFMTSLAIHETIVFFQCPTPITMVPSRTSRFRVHLYKKMLDSQYNTINVTVHKIVSPVPTVVTLYGLIATVIGVAVRAPDSIVGMMLEILHWWLRQILSVGVIHKLAQDVKALCLVVLVPIFIAYIFVVRVDRVVPKPPVAFFYLISQTLPWPIPLKIEVTAHAGAVF